MRDDRPSILPNAFQTPNDFIDRFMAFLTPEEFKVLIYVVRRTLGFHKTRDQISLSQLATGLVNENGKQLDWGTGLSKPAIMRAIDSMIEFGLIEVITPGNFKTHEGTLYALQTDTNEVNLPALRQRVEEKRTKDRARTEKARAKQLNGDSYSVGLNSDEENEDSGDDPATMPSYSVGLNSDNNGTAIQSDTTAKPEQLVNGTEQRYSVGLTNNMSEEKQKEKQIRNPRASPRGAGDSDPAKKKKTGDPNQEQPACLVIYELTGRRPAKLQAELLAEAICDVDLWRGVVRRWILHGRNKTDVLGMIGWYRDETGGPPNGRPNGSGNGLPYGSNGHDRAAVPKNGLAGGAMPEGTLEAERAARHKRKALEVAQLKANEYGAD